MKRPVSEVKQLLGTRSGLGLKYPLELLESPRCNSVITVDITQGGDGGCGCGYRSMYEILKYPRG
jgi:hypothetical protein